MRVLLGHSTQLGMELVLTSADSAVPKGTEAGSKPSFQGFYEEAHTGFEPVLPP
jgi:hypothetical protein